MTQPEPPSWYTAGVPWAPVHQQPANTALNLPQLDQQQLDALRQQLIENILRAVVLALQQTFFPGPIGAAFQQLTQWGNGVNTSTSNWTSLFSSMGFATVTDFVNFLNSIGAPALGALVDALYTFVTGTASTGVDQSSLTALLNNPIPTATSWLQKVLSPAGALTSVTQFPAYLLSAFAPGTSTTNLIPDPNFTLANQLDGVAGWARSTLAPTGALPGAGSAQVTANGTLLELEGVPMPVSVASGSITAGADVFWQAVTAAAGQAFYVAVNSYSGLNADGSVILPALSDPTRIVASISSPATNAPSWQTISGQYAPPAGTKYATLVFGVNPTVSAGPINFGSALFETSDRIDASLLGNMPGIPTIPGLNVEGFQGLATLIDAFGHLVDGIGSSASLTDQTGLQFSGMFSLLQGLAQNALSAFDLSNSHQQQIATPTNFPLSVGLDQTSEATFDLASLPHGATVPTTTVATGNAIGGPINIWKAATKGFIKFYASIAAGSTGVYVNAFKINPSTGVRTLLWGSTDIASQIPTSIVSPSDPVKVLIPGASQPAVATSDLIHVEVVNQSANTLTIVQKQNPQPTRSTGIIRNYGIARVTGGSISPSTIADTAFTYSGITPWISFGVATVPPNYWPPITQKIITPAGSGQAAGYSAMAVQAPYTTSVTLPSQFRPGIDYVDYIIAPAGGGGDSGTGGSGGSAGDTTVTIDGVAHHAAGTVGANNGGVFDSGAALSVGKGLGNYTYNGQLYQAGGDVGAQSAGSVPGGGGGGGAQFVGFKTAYGEGASKGTWVAGTTQPTNMTIGISLGYGGNGQNNYNAGDGADAGVWLRIYQNTAA